MRKTFITTSIIAAALAMPAFADPTAQELLDQKTVTSKYYVDTTKQDIIPTDKVLAIDNGGKDDVYVPAIVTTNDAGTELNGNSVGLLTGENAGDGGISEFGVRDDLVPSVGLVNDEFSYVYDEIYTKQGVIPAGTDGDVITYSGVEGEVGSATISSSATYSNNTLQNGSDIANITAVETKQNKMTCAGYVTGHEGDMNYCWLYGEVEVACKQGKESCEYNGECCSNRCIAVSGQNNKKCVGSSLPI